MSPTPPPPSPSPSVEPDEAQPSLPPTQSDFKTPERKHGASRPAPDITPLSRGSSMRQKQEGDTDRVEKFNRSDYDDYIREDLMGRVFVDFEVFMKHVLHVPDNWRTTWGPTIEAIKADSDFKKHHEEYCKHCNKRGSHEKVFYEPLMSTANAALDVLSRSTLGATSPEVTQYYRVNDPKKLRGGVFNKFNLSPDLVVLHKDCKPSEKDGLHWANPLHILEVKPFDSALCDGGNISRLVVNGVDPVLNHAYPAKPARYAKKPNARTPSTNVSESNSMSSNPRKRLPDESSMIDQPAKKPKRKYHLDPILDGGASTQVGQSGEGSSTSIPETQNQVEPAIQVCRYLLEMFSVPLLRSHATVSLVDRDRLQLYHANRSVILVTSAIKFSEDEGLTKFIAMIIAFNRLSFEQSGILDNLAKNNTKLVKELGIPTDNKVVQKGNQLEFQEDGSQDKFTVNLGDVISRDPATVGRSTVVLQATSDQWEETDLVVKISWPGSNRVRETEFLKRAGDEAKKSAGKWATKHLPRVFYAMDVIFGKNSALESVARLFKNAKFANGNYVYERRTLRIIVQERLYPLKSLTNVRDIGQVFLDVACIHRWLFDIPGILHRDLSPNNIMCRFIEEMNAKGKLERKVYGVLTDYDLSSLKEALEGDYTRTSQQRTGTPPYMAQELLRGTSATHLYRHDLESLFYIMLLMTARHTIAPTNTAAKFQVVMREGPRPYQEWFNAQDYNTLGKHKLTFLSEKEPIHLSPPFEDFRPWLRALRYVFSEGFKYKNTHPSNQEELPPWMLRWAGGSVPGATATSTPLEDETLGGYVHYPAIIEPTRDLKGELEGLTIRYETTLPPFPILTGAVQANA